VTVVSAPAGSGKTSLLRSWVAAAGLASSVGWVSVEPQAQDPQRFWVAVLDALRATRAGSTAVQALSPAPDLDGGAIVERLLEDLGSLAQPLWLVIDDLHELRSEEALRQLALLVMRAPVQLRFVLSTRSDPRLGLHRPRLEGELTEIRNDDLRFSLDASRAFFEAAGVELSESALALLHERTEGWAAGLRLAALSLEGHPDPERFAAEFSGSERTVADYLFAEVLEHQPEPVRRFLLRTSVLERVNGALADLLTGSSGGERTLQELEDAGAYVTSLDARRSWFRYHPLFAELLQLELRRTSPGELRGLHVAAAEWYAGRGYPVEAVRQAQAAEDWGFAARVLADHWTGLELTGRRATAQALIGAFPPAAITGDPELAAMAACDQFGSPAERARLLALAERGAASVSTDRRGRFEVWLTSTRLSLAARRGDLPAAIEDAERLLAPAGSSDAALLGLGDEYRAKALLGLGEAESSTFRLDDAERHLDHALVLARGADLPFLELFALAELAYVASMRASFRLAEERGTEAIALARRHGWRDERIAGLAYTMVAVGTLVRGQLEEAEPWLVRAERTLRAEEQPAAGAGFHMARGMLELARGRGDDALAAFRACERVAERLFAPHMFALPARSLFLQTLVSMGQADRVEQLLADMQDAERETAEMRTALAALRLAQNDPEAATDALLPILDGSIGATNRRLWLLLALVLEATARDALADAGAAERALERALDLAEPDGTLLPFMLSIPPELLERHRRCRTSHASLVSDILSLLAGNPSPPRGAQPVCEPLSESETRILRYLPTNLSAREIGDELYLAVSTVKTHMQHIYGKLGVHRRAEAVERARALHLLAPSSLAAR
jgi:LuxR family transcriptional regulator, maltose regulon positive regulatory protein